MKLAVIGGGGVRSPFLAKSLARSAAGCKIDSLVFMDISAERLALFGQLSKTIAQRINPSLSFELTTDMIAAVHDADYIITTIRSGGDESRVFDELTALNAGVLGQETTGAGGFAMALRSVPVLLDLCRLVRIHAHPGAVVFNFTNPSGLVTQAMRNAGYDFVYGVCDAPSGFEKQLIRQLNTTEDQFQMTCFGLNHLSWYRDFLVDGQDAYEAIMNSPALFKQTDLRYFDPKVLNLVGQRDLPNEYLYFYYYRDHAIRSISQSQITRGQTIQEINRNMISELEAIDLEQKADLAFDIFIRYYHERESRYFAIESGTSRVPVTRMPTLQQFIDEPDDGGYAGVALKFIQSRTGRQPVRMVLSVPNEGALPFLEDQDVVEISCLIGSDRVTPVPVTVSDPLQINLIRNIKFFERETIAAIMNRDREAALRALMMHPLVNAYPISVNLLDRYLAHYRDYVGVWS